MSTCGFGSDPVHLARAAAPGRAGIGGDDEDDLVILAQAPGSGIAPEIDGEEPRVTVVGMLGIGHHRLLVGS